MLPEFFQSELIALAISGSLVALSFWPAASKVQAAGRVFVGTSLSCVTTPFCIEILAWKLPDTPGAVVTTFKMVLFFWVGLLGVQIVPGLIALLKQKIEERTK